MKTNILLLLLALSWSISSTAQDSVHYSHNFSIGADLIGFDKHGYFTSIDMTTPYFMKKTTAVRLRASISFFDYIAVKEGVSIENAAEDKTDIYSLYLGLRYKISKPSSRFRQYLEAGVVGIIPNNDISSDKFSTGFYAFFGAEYMRSDRDGYFIEAGGTRVKTKAEKVLGKPYYASGFQVVFGWRFYLGR